MFQECEERREGRVRTAVWRNCSDSKTATHTATITRHDDTFRFHIDAKNPLVSPAALTPAISADWVVTIDPSDAQARMFWATDRISQSRHSGFA